MLTVAFAGGPFGFGVPIVYACISWAIAWLALVHLVWNLEHFSRVENSFKGVVALLGTIIGVYVVISPIRIAYIKEKARATSGDLVAVDDGKDHSSDPPILQIGPNGTQLPYTGPQNTPVIAAPYDKIQLKMVKGRVYLTTTVRDDNKNLIVEIIDNHWIVSSATANCWDKNYTQDSLEVKDGHGRVVFQVRIFPNIAQMQVEWASNMGTPFPGGISQAGKYDQKTGIKPMFRYPSELYWGQLEAGPY